MAFKNTRSFDPKKMGKKARWCLQNCRLGFGIGTGMRVNAKQDWQLNVQHKDKNFPKGVWVPVYWDVPSANEHVTVTCGDGYHYSDGVRVKMWTSTPCFGWGELCDGRRVVEQTASPSPVPSPAPTTGELPSRGYWKSGDRGTFIERMNKWLVSFAPAYVNKKALGPVYGPYAVAAVTEFQERAKGQGRYSDKADGFVGPKTIAAMKSYGFKG